MRIIPVIDILDGVVVRGVAGKRSEYRPIESQLVAGSDPTEIARAFRDQLGLHEIYVADLDGVVHGRPNYRIFEKLSHDGFSLLVDAGVRHIREAADVLAAGATAMIAALETSPGPDHIRALCGEFGSERVIFSLDLTDGRPLVASTEWESSDPLEIGIRGVRAGIGRMIVLDLSHVGVDKGIGTSDLCRSLRDRHPQLRIITGGGVRNIVEFQSLEPLELDGVLVASALHSGAISAKELQVLRSKTSG